MRRAAIGLLLALAVAGCNAGNRPEETAMRKALVDAHVARAAVSHLVGRYAEVFEAPAASADAPPRSWEDVAAYRGSAEGLAATKYLSDLAKTDTADPALPRAADIDALDRATTDLVSVALEPKGSWEEFGQEIARTRDRLDQAVADLEKGAKNHVLIEARSETNMKTAAYTAMLAQAKAGAPGAGGAPTPAQ